MEETEDLQDSKEDMYDMKFLYEVGLGAVQGIYEDAKLSNLKSALIIRTIKKQQEGIAMI